MNILALANGHSSDIYTITIDENFIYSGAEDKTIRIWDKKTKSEVALLKGHQSYINNLIVDENFIYSGSGDCSIGIWDKKNYNIVRFLKGHKYSINFLSIDDHYIYSSSQSGIIIWKKKTLEKVTFKAPFNYGMRIFAINNGCLYTEYDNRLIIYDVMSKKIKDRIELGVLGKKKIYIDEDRIYLVKDNWIGIWNKKNLKFITKLEKHEAIVSSIAFDDKFIYSASYDKTIRIWDKEHFEQIAILHGHLNRINDICTDKSFLFTCSSDSSIRIWDKKKRIEVFSIKDYSIEIDTITSDDKYVYSNSKEYGIQIWSKFDYKDIAHLKGHIDRVNSITFDDNFIYSTSNDKTIRIWKKNTWELIDVLKGHLNSVIDISVDEDFIYSGSNDGTIRIWNKKTHKMLEIIDGYNDSALHVHTLAVDKKYIYSGYFNEIRIWDKISKKELKPIKGHLSTINSLIIDENFIYTGSNDKTIKIWDKNCKKEYTTLLGHEYEVKTITIDEDYVYSGSWGNDIYVWSKKNFKHIDTLKGHCDSINIIFTDDQFIYSGSNDKTIRLWHKNGCLHKILMPNPDLNSSIIHNSLVTYHSLIKNNIISSFDADDSRNIQLLKKIVEKEIIPVNKTDFGFSLSNSSLKYAKEKLASYNIKLERKNEIEENDFDESQRNKNQIPFSRRMKRIKTVVIGNAAAGKTSLIKRLMFGEIPTGNRIVTEGLDIYLSSRSSALLRENKKTEYIFWDFGGQTNYQFVHHFFLNKDSNIFIFVFNGTQNLETTFDQIKLWLGDYIKLRQKGHLIFIGTHYREPGFQMKHSKHRQFITWLKEFTKKSERDLKTNVIYVSNIEQDKEKSGINKLLKLLDNIAQKTPEIIYSTVWLNFFDRIISIKTNNPYLKREKLLYIAQRDFPNLGFDEILLLLTQMQNEGYLITLGDHFGIDLEWINKKLNNLIEYCEDKINLMIERRGKGFLNKTQIDNIISLLFENNNYALNGFIEEFLDLAVDLGIVVNFNSNYYLPSIIVQRKFNFDENNFKNNKNYIYSYQDCYIKTNFPDKILFNELLKNLSKLNFEILDLFDNAFIVLWKSLYVIIEFKVESICQMDCKFYYQNTEDVYEIYNLLRIFEIVISAEGYTYRIDKKKNDILSEIVENKNHLEFENHSNLSEDKFFDNSVKFDSNLYNSQLSKDSSDYILSIVKKLKQNERNKKLKEKFSKIISDFINTREPDSDNYLKEKFLELIHIVITFPEEVLRKYLQILTFLVQKSHLCSDSKSFLNESANKWIKANLTQRNVEFEKKWFQPKMWAILKEKFGCEVNKEPETTNGFVDFKVFSIPLELKAVINHDGNIDIWDYLDNKECQILTYMTHCRCGFQICYDSYQYSKKNKLKITSVVERIKIEAIGKKILTKIIYSGNLTAPSKI